MLQERLKTQTAQAHSDLERLMFVDEIMQRTLTVDQYKTILITNYIAHKQYEDAIYQKLSARVKQELDIENRAKLAALALDLKESGISEDEVNKNITQSSATIPNEAFALGAMYVLEGATMGGSVIIKQLAKNDNFSDQFGFHYYNCYRDQLMPKWKQFVQVLNTLPEDAHQDSIDGANFMFKEIANYSLAQTI